MTLPQMTVRGDAEAGARTDGPWRVAEACILCAMAGAESQSDATRRLDELAASLVQIGVPVAKTVVAASGDLTDLLREAARQKLDILILDADAAIEPDAVMELRRVAATDPMIAGVSPRLGEAGSPRGTMPAWQRALPAAAYGPLGDPRCLFVKGSVLAQFDIDTEGAPFDWDAYALRINAAGFRMVQANHTSFRLRGGRSHSPSLAERAARLEPEFPGAQAAMAAFLSGTPHAAERILAASSHDATGRRTVAFDLTHIGAKYSGTAQAAVALVRRAALAWAEDWSVAVLAPAETHAFHFGALRNGPARIDPGDPRLCAAVIRIGQPFSWKEMDAAVSRAPVLVVFMLDTIGLDCIRMAPDDLDALWRFTLSEADGLLFNSAFTERQFDRRFGLRAGQPRSASLHALDTADYAHPRSDAPADGSILVIGNAFVHKHVDATARLLARACAGRRIVALGLAERAVKGVEGHPSGALDDAALASLYGRAGVVVYPSLYEGFGLPLLEALAHRKPVLVRALEPFAEIIAEVPEAANIHVFETDEDLVRLIGADLTWIEPAAVRPARGWDDGVVDLRRVLDEAVAAVDHDRIMRRIDFLRGRLTWIRQKPFRSDPASGDDVDRLAALAGRLALRAVHRIACLPGSKSLIRLAMGAGGGRRSGPFPEKIIAICHCHHADLVPELIEVLGRLPTNAEIHVSSSREAVLERWRAFDRRKAPAVLHLVENRGRDMRPFFDIARTLAIGPDTPVLKIHGKQSAYTKHGRHWRRDLLKGLLPNRNAPALVAARFRDEPRLGMIGAPGSYIGHPVYWGKNRDMIGRLMRDRFGTTPAERDLGFFAGSMFWMRGALLLDLLPHIDIEAFDPEPLPQDGTYAHAIERIIGMAARQLGWEAAELGDPACLALDAIRERKIPYL